MLILSLLIVALAVMGSLQARQINALREDLKDLRGRLGERTGSSWQKYKPKEQWTVFEHLNEIERQGASNNAAYEMLEPLVDNHEKAVQAQATLSILHAESMTRLQGQVDEMKRRPFFSPQRKDN